MASDRRTAGTLCMLGTCGHMLTPASGRRWVAVEMASPEDGQGWRGTDHLLTGGGLCTQVLRF